MSKKRKQYSAQLKAKVALEALRGEKTIAEIAAQYEIHPTMIHNWKRQLWEEPMAFLNSNNKRLRSVVEQKHKLPSCIAELDN